MNDELQAFDKTFDDLESVLSGQQLQRVSDAAAAPMLAIARALVPKATGETERHIDLEHRHGAHSATTSVVVEESGPGGIVHKAVFVEYGTENMLPQPFMRPAFEQGKGAAIQQAERAAQALLQPFST